MTKTVLILGASGRSGGHAAKAFAADGWTVRRFDRSKDDIVEAATGADVIFNGMNPPNYQNWAENIPRITSDVIAAAQASGATVIVPGNVYVYGNQSGVMSADTPHNATSRKGKIRARMEATYRQAAREGVQVIILRAGDFIDPEGNEDAMEVMMLRALKKDRLTYAGDVSAVRAHCYLPDFAKAAVMLVNRRKQLDMFEDIPFAGHSFSMLGLKSELEALTGQDLKLVGFPWWLFRALSPVWELARELTEMRYLWSLDHQLDNARIAELLPEFRATSLEEVLKHSVANVLGSSEAAEISLSPQEV